MRTFYVLFVICTLIGIVSCNQSSEEVDPIDEEPVYIHGIIHDKINGVPVILYADNHQRTLMAFKRTVIDDAEILEFEEAPTAYPDILIDQFGRTFDINGRQTDNPGNELEQLDYVLGYWFFFPAMFEKVILASGDEIDNPSFNEGEGLWSVDTDFVFIGATRDGIPSIDNPQFEMPDDKELIENEFYASLDDDELMTIVQVGGTMKAYPHRILEYHEVVNDEIDGISFSVNFCPLTGTSFAWDRTINGEVSEFGVSGLLYNNNLILYDRTTESLWSQILGTSVFGNKKDESIQKYRIYETTYRTVKRSLGTVQFLSTATGSNYDYTYSLYPDYKTDARVSFPISNQNDTYHTKDRVLGIVDGTTVKVYSFSDFQ